jgi:predicted transglutaminase-like protease
VFQSSAAGTGNQGSEKNIFMTGTIKDMSEGNWNLSFGCKYVTVMMTMSIVTLIAIKNKKWICAEVVFCSTTMNINTMEMQILS